MDWDYKAETKEEGKGFCRKCGDEIQDGANSTLCEECRYNIERTLEIAREDRGQ